MRKLGLEWDSASTQAMLARPTTGRLRHVPMATMAMRLTHARLTGTTALIILQGACLSARGPGSAAMVAATMAEGVVTTVAVDIVAKVDGMAVLDSVGTR